MTSEGWVRIFKDRMIELIRSQDNWSRLPISFLERDVERIYNEILSEMVESTLFDPEEEGGS